MIYVVVDRRRDVILLDFLRDYEKRLTEESLTCEKSFVWFDAFAKRRLSTCCMSARFETKSVQVELACTRWNLASLLLYLAGDSLVDEPLSDDELKTIVDQFQEAAGIFTALRATMTQLRMDQITNDMEDDTLAALANYSLSGAQATLMAKATSAHVKAKLACGAYELLESIRNYSECPRQMLDDVTNKTLYFQACAQFYQSNKDRDDGKHGLVIARRQNALAKMQNVSC